MPYTHSRVYLTDYELVIFNNIGHYSDDYQEVTRLPSLQLCQSIFEPSLYYASRALNNVFTEQEEEETSVSWLTNLHLLHEQWLLPYPVHVLDGALLVTESVEQSDYSKNTNVTFLIPIDEL